MERRAAQRNSGSVPPPQTSASPPPPPPPTSTVAPSPPPTSTTVISPPPGSSTASSSPASSRSSSVALPISSTSGVTQSSQGPSGSSVSLPPGSTTIARGTVPRGPTNDQTSSGTATINSTEDNVWTDTVVAITWGSIGGVILLVIGILIWRNKRYHDKEDETEPESYHPPVLRHPPRPPVPSGQYALSAAQLEQIQAQEDARQEQEEAMGFHVPYDQPGSRFSIVSHNGSVFAAPPPLYLVPNSNEMLSAGTSPGGRVLHRMASAPVFVRPVSIVGSSTPATGTPNSAAAPLSPVTGMSAESSPYPQKGPYPVPVCMIPVTSAAQLHSTYATPGVQFAHTLSHHNHNVSGQEGGQGLGLGIAAAHRLKLQTAEGNPMLHENDKAQAALIPEGDNVQRRPSAENVRHRQPGGSPQSATGGTGSIPHSSSTFSLTED